MRTEGEEGKGYGGGDGTGEQEGAEVFVSGSTKKYKGKFESLLYLYLRVAEVLISVLLAM